MNIQGIKILGAHISNDAAELILQVPVKNSLKRRYPIILAGNGESIKLGFKIPGSSRKTYTISAIASAKDREGNNYIKSASTTISLQNTFNLKKITSNSILGKIYILDIQESGILELLRILPILLSVSLIFRIILCIM